MPGLNTSHDVSGHRYGKGELPIGSLANAARKAFLAGRDKKRKELEKNKPKDDNKTTDKEPEPPKSNKVFIAGNTIGKRPVELPSPTIVGEGGRVASNEDYWKAKQRNTDAAAHYQEQLTIQNHSNHQFQNYAVPHLPGKPMRATGYGPTNPKTGGFNKVKMGKLQKEANNIEALRAHNRELQSRRPQPPAAESTPPSTGEAPKTISDS